MHQRKIQSSSRSRRRPPLLVLLLLFPLLFSSSTAASRHAVELPDARKETLKGRRKEGICLKGFGCVVIDLH
jgi:hypothetical protein